MKFRYKITWNGFAVTHVTNGLELDREIRWVYEKDPKAEITIEIEREDQ